MHAVCADGKGLEGEASERVAAVLKVEAIADDLDDGAGRTRALRA
jgi:hypothetical protein